MNKAQLIPIDDTSEPIAEAGRPLDRHLRNALLAEAEAIETFAWRTSAMAKAVHAIHDATGPLVVAGVGKSGHIARKIASTFRSLGKPAVFLHPAEASHGDLGMIQPGSVVLVLSNSGETTELSDLVHFCLDGAHKLIALTGQDDSTLARMSEIAIVYGPVAEVCVNGLAPTTSTTLSLAIGDALAVGYSHLARHRPEDFRRYHPGGKLGARLATAGDLARRGEALAWVAPGDDMASVVVAMTEKSMGAALVGAPGMIADGIITDGDLRRHARTLWSLTAGDVATPDPRRIPGDMPARDAAALMGREGILVLLVDCDDGPGLLHLHDCLAGGGAQA